MFNIQKIKLVDNCASVWYESRLKFDGIGLKLRFDIVWHSIKIHVDSPQSAIICVLFVVVIVGQKPAHKFYFTWMIHLLSNQDQSFIVSVYMYMVCAHIKRKHTTHFTELHMAFRWITKQKQNEKNTNNFKWAKCEYSVDLLVVLVQNSKNETTESMHWNGKCKTVERY